MRLQVQRPDWPDWPQNRDDYVHVEEHLAVPRAVDAVPFRWVEIDTGATACTVTVDVRFEAGEARVSRMAVDEGVHRLTKTLLATVLDPEMYARDALAFYGFTTSGPGENAFTPDPEAALEALAALPRRRTVDGARLEEVAAAYRRGGVDAVVRDCHRSKSQAYRLVTQARNAGKLPEVSA
jgi:hypothetical protein